MKGYWIASGIALAALAFAFPATVSGQQEDAGGGLTLIASKVEIKVSRKRALSFG